MFVNQYYIYIQTHLLTEIKIQFVVNIAGSIKSTLQIKIKKCTAEHIHQFCSAIAYIRAQT